MNKKENAMLQVLEQLEKYKNFYEQFDYSEIEELSSIDITKKEQLILRKAELVAFMKAIRVVKKAIEGGL